MLATKKFVEKRIDEAINQATKKITAETIPMCKNEYRSFQELWEFRNVNIYQSIGNVINALEEKIVKIENWINKKNNLEIKTLKRIKEEQYTIDRLDGILVSYEDPNNALDEIERLLKNNIPFKMNKKLKKIYLETTKAEQE